MRRYAGIGIAREMSSMSGKSEAPRSRPGLFSAPGVAHSGEFEPGTRMSELPLVERLGVSRTPLRLALATLEHEGLLELLPGGGYATRQFSQADVTDAIELRGVLEGTAARWAAERGVPRRELTRMGALVDRMDVEVHRADYGSFVNYVELNESFHTRACRGGAQPHARAGGGRHRGPAVRLRERVRPHRGRAARVARILRGRAGPAPGTARGDPESRGRPAESIAREHARLARRTWTWPWATTR